MLERLEPGLKIICAALAALLLYQVGRLVVHRDPLAYLVIPALPALAADTNASASGNATASAVAPAAAKLGTNTLQSGAQNLGKGTNAPAILGSVGEGTNIADRASAKAGTNLVTLQPPGKSVTNSSANAGSMKTETNSAPNRQNARSGTNATSDQVPGKGETNSAALPDLGKPVMNPRPRPGMAAMGMNPFGGPAGMKPPDLAPPILARVDRITDSEILGPVIRPLPMGLLGIAGNVAFLRAPNGQTGVVKEGDELSGLKLLRIGTNRVLVEQDGQKQELTIFSGFGGESLMTKPKENFP